MAQSTTPTELSTPKGPRLYQKPRHRASRYSPLLPFFLNHNHLKRKKSLSPLQPTPRIKTRVAKKKKTRSTSLNIHTCLPQSGVRRKAIEIAVHYTRHDNNSSAVTTRNYTLRLTALGRTLCQYDTQALLSKSWTGEPRRGLMA